MTCLNLNFKFNCFYNLPVACFENQERRKAFIDVCGSNINKPLIKARVPRYEKLKFETQGECRLLNIDC